MKKLVNEFFRSVAIGVLGAILFLFGLLTLKGEIEKFAVFYLIAIYFFTGFLSSKLNLKFLWKISS
ncbi:MAG: hypothetical protein QW802_01425 [Candidatus Altiarchaeota archaeon]